MSCGEVWEVVGEENLFIPVILGTARKGRLSEHAAKFVFEIVKKRAGVETQFVDVKDFGLSATDNTETSAKAKKFGGLVARADALLIVSPEYNHGYPGELKLALDQAYKQYARKPVAICGVSGGGLGGARMVEQLRQVVIELSMVPVRGAVYFSKVNELFDASGNIADASYEAKVNKLLEELEWHARALKKERES